MLRFPYQDEPLTGPPPPTLPPGSTVRWRPLVPVEILGPTGISRQFGRAVVDPAADDTVFPIDTATRIGAQFLPATGHGVRWRGQLHPLRFADVELILDDGASVLRWPAVVAFSPASIRYPILGRGGCLQFLDVAFYGLDLVVTLQTNLSYPGTERGSSPAGQP
jgi:hypothetical protein